jgi:hypothetical protein
MIVLTAVGAFAASLILGILGHNSQPQKRIAEMRQEMQAIREMRAIKAEFLEAQDTKEDETTIVNVEESTHERENAFRSKTSNA